MSIVYNHVLRYLLQLENIKTCFFIRVGSSHRGGYLFSIDDVLVSVQLYA